MVMEILMTIDEFLQAIKKTAPPAPTHKLAQLEVALGVLLPDVTKGSCRHATAATLVAPSGTKDLLQPEILLTPVCTTLAGFVRSRTSRWSGLESAMPDAFQTSSYGSWTTLSVMRSVWEYEEPIGATSTFGITRWSPTQTVGTVKSIPQETCP